MAVVGVGCWQNRRMPTGSLSPTSYPSDVITIRCHKCARLGRYRRTTLVERCGADAAMPDILNDIAACERNDRPSTDRCKAVLVELANAV